MNGILIIIIFSLLIIAEIINEIDRRR